MPKFQDFYELQDHVNSLVEEYIEEHAQDISCEEIGVDRRSCYSTLHMTEYEIFVPASAAKTFAYYAGGEYVHKDHVRQVGDYVVYLAGTGRVDGWLINGQGRCEDDDNEEE